MRYIGNDPEWCIEAFSISPSDSKKIREYRKKRQVRKMTKLLDKWADIDEEKTLKRLKKLTCHWDEAQG
jgi:hypothetical protein